MWVSPGGDVRRWQWTSLSKGADLGSKQNLEQGSRSRIGIQGSHQTWWGEPHWDMEENSTGTWQKVSRRSRLSASCRDSKEAGWKLRSLVWRLGCFYLWEAHRFEWWGQQTLSRARQTAGVREENKQKAVDWRDESIIRRWFYKGEIESVVSTFFFFFNVFLFLCLVHQNIYTIRRSHFLISLNLGGKK